MGVSIIDKKAPVRRLFEPEAFHFYFVVNLSILKPKFKNLAVFVNRRLPLGLALISYVLYTLLYLVLLNLFSIGFSILK